MTRRQALSLLLAASAAAGLTLSAGCSRHADPWPPEAKVRAVVTFAPLYSLVKAVGGDRVAVKSLCTTTGPHHFQADAKDAILFKKADVFFAVGLGLDDNFADQLHAMSRRNDLPYVKLGTKLPRDRLLESKHEHVMPDGSKHSHGHYDPHVWLGLPEMLDLTDAARDALTAADPAGAEAYKKGADEFKGKLRELMKEGREKLDKKTNKRIVSSHEALGYFAGMLKLDVVGTVQPWPGEAPTAKHLSELTKLCGDKDKPVGAITVEPQYRGSGASGMVQRSVKEVKVPLVEIDTLETADEAELAAEGASWYLTRMKRNIDALASALP